MIAAVAVLSLCSNLLNLWGPSLAGSAIREAAAGPGKVNFDAVKHYAGLMLVCYLSSALDYRTDAELRKALRAHHAGATTVVIAQRVSSILSMDEIIVLHEGEMIGRGTHEELLVSCPEYRDICRIQLSETEVG